MHLVPEPNDGGGGNPDWDDLSNYYEVYAWMYPTDNPSNHLKTAMRLYVYENGTWIEKVFHDYNNMAEDHYFGKIPLGNYSCVRASLDWGLWSRAPDFDIAVMLSAKGEQFQEFEWGNYTIHVDAEAKG